MGVCEVCGNEYDKTFEVSMPGDPNPHTFDSFECAVHALAPSCAHCGCRIIGHGVEAAGAFYAARTAPRSRGFPSFVIELNEFAF